MSFAYPSIPDAESWHAPSGRAADESRVLRYDRVAEWLLFSQIIGATVFQKIAIPLGGDKQAYFGLLIMFGATAVGLATRRLGITWMRFALFMLMAGGMVATQLLGGYGFSILSLLMLLTVHIPYVFGLRNTATRPGIELDFFQKVMAIMAVAGILQYGLQFVIGWKAAFFLDTTFPHAFIFQGFHELNPLGYGSRMYKSNGFFFLEPAIFSQMLALAAIIEMIRFRSWKRMALYLIALLTTFSGTGFVMLGLLVPVFLIQKRQYVLLAAVVFALATAGLWAPFVGLESVIDRITEFSNSESSGYARFISIFRTIYDYILPHADALFFGMGAGSITGVAGQTSYAMHDPSWGKVVFEYGLIGALAYFPLMLNIFFTAPRSAYIRAALAIQFLFLGEYVLSPTVHGLIVALLAWPLAQAALGQSRFATVEEPTDA